jgi:hypothetical protein
MFDWFAIYQGSDPKVPVEFLMETLLGFVLVESNFSELFAHYFHGSYPRGPKDLKNDTGSVNFSKPFWITPLSHLPKWDMLDQKW